MSRVTTSEAEVIMAAAFAATSVGQEAFPEGGEAARRFIIETCSAMIFAGTSFRKGDTWESMVSDLRATLARAAPLAEAAYRKGKN